MQEYEKNSLLKFDIGNVTIKIMLQGLWHWENNTGSAMHNHSSYDFHFLMRGQASLETEKQSMPIYEKDAVLIPPEVFHSFIIKEKGSALISFSFRIDKDRRKNCTDYYSILQKRLLYYKDIIVLPQNSNIEEYITKIISNIYAENIVWEDYEKALFTE